MYETMYNAGIVNAVDIVACGSYRVTPERKRISSKVNYSHNLVVTENIFEKFCSFQFGSGILWNKLFRRDIVKPLKGLHYPWRQNTNEDLLLNIGLFLNASSVCLVKDMLHEYVLSEGTVTSSIGKVESFVDMYRAYAIGVSVYSYAGETVLRNLTSMYRRQFEFPSYRLSSIGDLHDHGSRLQEAVELILEFYPIGLALIAARSPRAVSLRREFKNFISRTILATRKLRRS
jgi:hypothetical protein